MTDPIRSALKRLLSAVLDGLGQDDHPMGWARVDDAIDAARAALAYGPAVPQGREPASVTEQPSDEEIMGLMPQQMHEDLAYAARAMANEAGTDNRKVKGFMRIALNRHAVDLARAVLARWGNPTPQPPAAGEVAELVETLKGIAYWRLHGKPGDKPAPFDIRQAARLTRAAELLERLSPPQPVPVSERPPGPKDCLDEGWAWFFSPRVGWRQAVFPVSTAYTHWLPAHALPIPQQQKNAND